MRSPTSLLVFALLLALPAAAQDGTENIARVTVLRPRSGVGIELAQAYTQHLKWHAQARDPWTWLGWQVITGARVGAVVDGAFGRRWSDLDHPVDPASDLADFNRTVAPVGQVESVAIWKERLDLGGASFPADPARFMVMTTVQMRPAASVTIARSLKFPGCRNCTWFEVIGSGEQQSYVLVQQCQNWPEIAEATRRAAGMVSRTGAVSTNTEVLSYRADFLYRPETTASSSSR
ncbi:MAG: hypothetical protein L0099_11520 [Acidobacteria bacterium]|nr:hypothetical protein [Acidobacteriota bacterium]